MMNGRRRWWLAAFAVVIVIVLAGWRTRRSEAPLPVDTARRGEFVVDVETVGEMEALESRTISRPRVGGFWNPTQIIELAPEGSRVVAGDFLVQLDTSDAQQNLDQARNDHLNARAELTRQQAETAARLAELANALLNQQYSFEQAKLRHEQMRFEADVRRREHELDLRKAELSLQEAHDRLEAERVIAAATVEKAEYDVRRAAMQMEQAEEALGSLTISAPDSGLVVYKSFRGGKIKVGDQAWPGMDIIELPDLARMQVKTWVNEIDVRSLAVGQAVVVTVDALDGLEFAGEVTRIATLARTEGEAEVKVFDVDVLIDGPGGDLRPGMSSRCRIVTATHDDVVHVPLEAVFPRGDRSVVYVMNGGAEARTVVLGASNEDRVVILEGLDGDESVALTDPERGAGAETSAPADDDGEGTS